MRVLFLILTYISVLLGTSYFCLANSMLITAVIAVGVVDLVFFLLFFTALIHRRLTGGLFSGTSYMFTFISFVMGIGFLVLMSLVPAGYVPMMILPLLFMASLDGVLSLGVSVFLICIYSLCYGLSYITLFQYLCLAVAGAILGGMLKPYSRRINIWIFFIGLFVSFLITLGFRWIEYPVLDTNVLIMYGISAGIGAVFLSFVFHFLWQLFDREKNIRYEIILDDNYYIINEMRMISMPEYRHARTLSRISSIAARSIGCDEQLCEAIGLYYHAVNTESDKNMKRFTKRLYRHCFPTELITAIGEDGVEKLPTTKESAIVHMSDAILTKLEAIFKMADKSSWNINMVVYQTLNEMSAKGVYDRCGLSMNEFLTIRDILAKEEISL